MAIDSHIAKLRKFKYPGAKISKLSYESSGELHLSDTNILKELPNFYRLLTVTHTGDDGLVFCEIWLPDDWNGCLVGTGNGGMAGAIAYWGMADPLRRGYAVANTDMGTSRGRKGGIANPDVWKDFGWRATHIMTEQAKAAIKLHYGQPAEHSYFIGGSTGGQQALSEAQRFPEDYDGIVAGVPANNRTMLHTYFLWNHVHLRTRDGRRMFTRDEITAITDAVTEFFVGRDDAESRLCNQIGGETSDGKLSNQASGSPNNRGLYNQINGGEPDDNFISLPNNSDENIEAFLAYLRQVHPEFSSEQLSALRAVYAGPTNPRTGERIYNGMPFGAEIYGCGIYDCQMQESPFYFPFVWAFGADCDAYDFDFDKGVDRLNDALAGDVNANNPDLSGFAGHGGKLIIYSGSADPCVPFPDAMNYCDRVFAKMGGYDRVSEFMRYFLVPGQDHGSGGRGSNSLSGRDGSLLDTIRLWRERGIAPDALKASRCVQNDGQTKLEFERYIYPYGSDRFKPEQKSPACCERYLR